MRRPKTLVSESHFLRALASDPTDEKARKQYARWLRANGRAEEAEAVEPGLSAQAEKGLEKRPGRGTFDYGGLLEYLRADGDDAVVLALAGGALVVVVCNGWELFCDGDELRAYLSSTSGPGLSFGNLPGEMGFAPQEVLAKAFAACEGEGRERDAGRGWVVVDHGEEFDLIRKGS